MTELEIALLARVKELEEKLRTAENDYQDISARLISSNTILDQQSKDFLILDARSKLLCSGRKATGIAIAEMTGIAERTVYDRLEKMRGRQS